MSKPLLPSEILKHLDAIIVGQVEHKKRLAIGLYYHFFGLYSNEVEACQGTQPNNFFMLGPDGVGKEKLFSTIAAAFKAPHIVYNCDGISQFDARHIATKLLKSALSLQKDGVPMAARLQRSIVFLDNLHRISKSFDPDFCDLATLLQLEFDAMKVKVQARNLLVVSVCSCTSTYGCYDYKKVLRNHFPSEYYYSSRNKIRKVIEETKGCIYLTTRDIDMVGLSEPSSEVISGYRKDFALHGVTLEFTHAALVHMKTMDKEVLNYRLDSILPLAMWEIIGLNQNVVQVTFDPVAQGLRTLRYKKEK